MDTSASLRIRSACVVLRGAGEGGGDAWSAVERERVGRVHRQARWDRPEAESVAELLRGHVDGVDVALELGDAWCEPGPSAPARRAGKERRRKRHALPKSPRRLSRVISLSSVRDVSVQSGCDGSDGGGASAASRRQGHTARSRKDSLRDADPAGRLWRDGKPSSAAILATAWKHEELGATHSRCR